MINLYAVNIRDLSKNLESYYNMLKPERIERIERFVKNDDKLRCAVSGMIMAQIYGDGNPENIDVCENNYGKPCFRYLTLPNDLKEFNISHSGDWVIMSSSNETVGCDIEYCKDLRDFLKLADTAFHKEEIDFIKSRPYEEMKSLFYSIWTLKESYMKLIGTGFHTPPKSFSVVKDNELIQSFFYNGKKYYYNTFDFHGYKLSTAANDIQNKVQILRF